MSDDGVALDLDLALTERARMETWRDMREANEAHGDPDWFLSMLLLVMDLV